MRRLRDSHFVVASVAAHVVVGGALLLLRPRVEPARSRTILVEVRRREPPPVLPVVVEPAPAAPLSATPEPPRPRPPSRPQPVGAAPPPPPVAPAPVAPPLPASPPPPNRRPDLFNQRAIEDAVASGGTLGVLRSSPQLGRTTSIQNGGRDPNARDALADREGAASVLHGMIGEARRGDDLAKGRVAPRWRNAERAIYEGFAPAPEVITDENLVSNFFKSWANTKPSSGSTPRGVDDSAGIAPGFGGLNGGANSPAGLTEIPDHLKRRAVIEVELAADGSIVASRVKRHSGKRDFDEQARRLVVEKLDKGGPLDEKKGVLMEWAVDAWVLVSPPSPVGGFTFDEVSGKVSADHPMKKKVGKHVSLLSVRTLQ